MLMSANRPTIADAKARLDVPTLWKRLSLPGEPSRSCRCPLHEDRSASFSVYVGNKGSMRWKCHAGCGEGGPVELLARALDIDEREACRRLVQLAFGDNSEAPMTERPYPKPVPPPARRLVLPVGLNPGSRAEIVAVAQRRNLSFEGVSLAVRRGLLFFAASREYYAWIVTDRARVNAQARRIDGAFWEHIEAKAWTLPGSRAAWPVGTQEASELPFVALVEGAPDLLAAHHYIARERRAADVGAIAMLGASNQIPEDALKLLAGKRVRLFPHADTAGRAAAVRWTRQLEQVGCTVDAFRFDGLYRGDGLAVKDLNDLAIPTADRGDIFSGEVLPR